MTGCVVVNFNAPELNVLADALADARSLRRLVRPYVTRDRWLERAVSRLPSVGKLYNSTFGRRRLRSSATLDLTTEAGVVPDILAAAAARMSWIPSHVRGSCVHRLHERVRRSISQAAVPHCINAGSVVAYPGFAERAFGAALGSAPRPLRVLSYPIAHHRFHLALRNEEALREPTFQGTWPPLSHFTGGYLGQLDREIELADIVVVGSKFVRRSFVEHGVPEGKVKVIPYGVDLGVFDRPSVTAAHRPFTIVFAGQIGQRKGISYLLEGYRRFAQGDTRLVLIGGIVGDGSALAAHRSCFEHVAHLTRPDLAARFSQADAFVFPTLLEGMPLVVIEAMACGLPVITTARGADEIVRDGVEGFIVPVRDPGAIADRLGLLYHDAALRRRMGEAARRRAREFSWSSFASRFISLLRP